MIHLFHHTDDIFAVRKYSPSLSAVFSLLLLLTPSSSFIPSEHCPKPQLDEHHSLLTWGPRISRHHYEGSAESFMKIASHSSAKNDGNTQITRKGKQSQNIINRPSSSASHITERRVALSNLARSALLLTSSFAVAPQPSNAGEIGNKINAAVTQSDLGVSVRRSVVRGAQMMDKLDGKWERFSDDFGLGAERSKRDARPPPRNVPDPLPLSEDTALSLLEAADLTFLSLVSVSKEDLKDRINKVDSLVRKSFERGGLPKDETSLSAEQFNYQCYIHFKAYNDILIEQNVRFPPFRKKFENELGGRLISILTPTTPQIPGSGGMEAKSADSATLKKTLVSALDMVDNIINNLKSKGLVALSERSEIDSERLQDWSEDLADLQFSITLDKDVTQNSQILLQEQGFRLYPDFARFAVTSALKRYLSDYKQEVTSDEYYMDTNYNSDPDLFDVKQVLLNVVIESS